MNRLFKTAMFWLLALALPGQGYAAVTQSSCAPRMRQVVATAAVVQNIEHALQHSSANGMEPAHHQMHAQVDDANHVDADSTTNVISVKQSNTHANEKCSACTAGCVAMAMLPVMPELPAFPLDSTSVVASTSSLYSGHIADGLKRPARFSLI